ncbi:hypothetical protein ACIG3E_33385 [Streptomyces sp. NPDC053474]|uniref:hypothetical protein n=1 Tax=Streptomyces sp. NPDC053474 TaxID=3365704 RepID=UPI0037D3BA29
MSDVTVSFFARTIADDEAIFTRDVRSAAELMESIARNPDAGRADGELARLSQRVTDLVRLAAKIKASREAIELMGAQRDEAARLPAE